MIPSKTDSIYFNSFLLIPYRENTITTETTIIVTSGQRNLTRGRIASYWTIRGYADSRTGELAEVAAMMMSYMLKTPSVSTTFRL